MRQLSSDLSALPGLPYCKVPVKQGTSVPRPLLANTVAHEAPNVMA